MDERGRLAQSLKSKDRRRAPRGPKAARFNRARRFVHRITAPIIALDPPRGVGAAAAAVLIAASGIYGLVKGGHGAELAAEVHSLCDGLANRAGMRITAIALSGQSQLTRADVLDLAGVTNDSSLLCLDPAAARGKLQGNPWISAATVLKLYPGRLQVEIVERKPLALWQKDGAVSVIASDGTVLEPFNNERFAELPLVVGSGAEKQARDFLTLVARYPVVRDQVEASVLVAERRWNLRLKNGIDVRLPELDAEQALQPLVNLDRDKKLLSRDIAAIDLRLPDRVTVRLNDAAAQARTEAIKEQSKKPKKKEKGTDA